MINGEYRIMMIGEQQVSDIKQQWLAGHHDQVVSLGRQQTSKYPVSHQDGRLKVRLRQG